MRYGAADPEFSVNGFTVWYIQKKEEEIQQNVCKAAP